MLKFVHISDTHLGSTPDYTLHGRNTYNYARALVRHLNDRLPFAPDFVLHTGDITNYFEDEAGQLAAQVFTELKYPIYYVAGNHDSPALMRRFLLQQAGGNEPLYYDFTVQGFHFLVLDTRGKVDPQGYVPEEQLEWLQKKCASSSARSLCLVVHHLPLQTGNTWYDRDMRIMNEEALFDVLKPYQPRLRGVFCGHIHRPYSGYRDGILCSAAPSAAFQFYAWPDMAHSEIDDVVPGGYSIVTMTHEQTIVAHHFIQSEV